jgi:phage baseplate assembly protein W
LANKVPVGITLPYTRGNEDGFFKQTHSLLERARTNLSFLLMTAKGERPMMPEYGSDLRSIIFNPNTQDFLDEIIEDAVKDAASTYMKEVIINTVVVKRDLENNPYQATVDINFSINIIPDSEQTINLNIEV